MEIEVNNRELSTVELNNSSVSVLTDRVASIAQTGENILSVSASTWSVSLQLFRIDGEIPFDLFILTRISLLGKSSALYYFQKVAEEAFFRAVLEFEQEG